MALSTALPIKNWLLNNLSRCVLNVDDSYYIKEKANAALRGNGLTADLTEHQVSEAMALMTYDELNTPLNKRRAAEGLATLNK